MDTRSILLYGRSLLISLVANDLAEQPRLNVAQATTWEEVSTVLVDHMPDVLIFELADCCETHVLMLLLESPDLILIGLDPECNRAVLVSGHEERSLTMNQIREIVGRP